MHNNPKTDLSSMPFPCSISFLLHALCLSLPFFICFSLTHTYPLSLKGVKSSTEVRIECSLFMKRALPQHTVTPTLRVHTQTGEHSLPGDL